MSKKAFEKIAAGLDEAIAVARGDARPLRFFIPREIDVRAVRKKLAMTQEGFAAAFGFSVTQIRDWEQGRSRPLDALRAYLLLIESDAAHVLRALGEPPTKKKVA